MVEMSKLLLANFNWWQNPKRLQTFRDIHIYMTSVGHFQPQSIKRLFDRSATSVNQVFWPVQFYHLQSISQKNFEMNMVKTTPQCFDSPTLNKMTYPLTSYGDGTSLAVASILAMTMLGSLTSCRKRTEKLVTVSNLHCAWTYTNPTMWDK